MSAFETLPPDQRAVLQLILKQGRGYADLSGLLRIDEEAVRARAHAGLDALADDAGATLAAERRAQVADWLLGQQDDAQRAETVQHLRDSRAARRWAGAVQERLTPVANGSLPQIPGAAAHDEPAPDRDEEPTSAASDGPADLGATAPRPSRPAPAASPSGWDAGAREPRRASRLGGILLIAGVVALVAVLAVVLFGGGDDDEPATPAASTTPAGQTTAGTRTSPQASAGADQPILLQQVNLTDQTGGDAAGIALIAIEEQVPVIAVQVQGIDPNGESDVYAAWLRTRADGSARFLGYVPGLVTRAGRFTVRADLPRDTARYDQVVVTREPTSGRGAPASPGPIVLAGTMRVNRDAGATGTG